MSAWTKALPIRVWLWLILVVIMVVPGVILLLVGRFHEFPTELPLIDPSLRQTVVDNVDRWADPAWQTGFAAELKQARLSAELVDANGREIYRGPAPLSSIAPPPDAAVSSTTSGTDPVIVAQHSMRAGEEFVVAASGRRLGTARLSTVGGPNGAIPLPRPPISRFDFWLLPVVQMIALLIVAAVVAWFVDRALLRPLAAFSDATRQVAAGDLHVQLPASRIAEVSDVAVAFHAMSDNLRGSLERQAELEQERRMIVSAIVHDLRTPLFSLRGYLEGLATGLADSPEKAARYLRVSREKADALDRLITDLFAYTRTEYLAEVPRRDALELGDLLTHTVEGLQPQAAAKGVSLHLAAPGVRCSLTGDAHLLTRAIDNLLDNAIRYSPAAAEVRVEWRCVPGGVAFTVADTGPGIPPADLPHLFSPLYRGETSRNRRTGGAGLGLAIARRLVRAHGGDLIAANRPGGGAIFTGFLPAGDHPRVSSPSSSGERQSRSLAQV